MKTKLTVGVSDVFEAMYWAAARPEKAVAGATAIDCIPGTGESAPMTRGYDQPSFVLVIRTPQSFLTLKCICYL
ncbi:hypothetical protein RR46_02837 [Papilio xuthus]|uniref:Uncharacterized protein n=1 Tax=Papilio xuthus TaxID=66420 RepID=A0A194QD55_PAPXU|nr:hypothetical protein RR46_02837 [Papilio xuthus]